LYTNLSIGTIKEDNMANIIEPDEEYMREYEKMFEILPTNQQEVIKKFPPWKLYRLKSTNQRVEILTIGTDKDNTVKFRVDISGKYNMILFDRQVFGIDPDDLEECDLPDEPVGTLLTEEEDIDKSIEFFRKQMYPDAREN
jgi:hypothetical protein